MKSLVFIFFSFYSIQITGFDQDIHITHSPLQRKVYFPSAKQIKIYLDQQKNFENFYMDSGAINEHGIIKENGWLEKIANSRLTVLEAVIILQISMLDYAGTRQNFIIAFDSHHIVLEALFRKCPGVYTPVNERGFLLSKI